MKSASLEFHSCRSSATIYGSMELNHFPDFPMQLKWFLGLVAYYHRYIPHCPTLLRPLYALISVSGRTVPWTAESARAFEDAKAALAEATMLCRSRAVASLSLSVDASDTGIGAILNQHISNRTEPLVFSKNLQPRKMRYSIFGRELLDAYLAVRHFLRFLEGLNFTIYTHHKPLVTATFNASSLHSPREQRHLDYLLQFTSDIRHIKGRHKTVANVLSRIFTLLSQSLKSCNRTWQSLPMLSKTTVRFCCVVVTTATRSSVMSLPITFVL